jgi:chemotaxis family two-component system sensor kinase Cph1
MESPGDPAIIISQAASPSIGSEGAPDLTDCDREPIRVPGSIQPHGLLIVVDPASLCVIQGAGEIEGRLMVEAWLGKDLSEILGEELAQRIGRTARSGAPDGYMGQLTTPGGELLDVTAHRAVETILVELEPGFSNSAPASEVLGVLEAASANLARAATLPDLCDRAAHEFRKITGFDRVMLYRFLEDDAGKVVAESKVETLPTFLNHHFPASDIPRQARELYVRNLVRIIADVGYQPLPLRPSSPGAPLDMSDMALRSVSPVHIQYLKNMGVGASASVSIVVDGRLWGLIACHHEARRLLPYDARAACRSLAGTLARQIKARDEADLYRERVAMRAIEDDVLRGLARGHVLGDGLANELEPLRSLLNGDGFVVVEGQHVQTHGACPPEADLRPLVDWVVEQGNAGAIVTNNLARVFPGAAGSAALASGVFAFTIPGEVPITLIWLRAEHLQTVAWAGNPHAAKAAVAGVLQPRASFEAWSDTVRRIARDWSAAEIETGARLKVELQDLRRQRRIADLNAELSEALNQKELLVLEMNHRMQNSLQLVSAFLGMQARASHDPAFEAAVEEARRRLSAVSLVHRRLYRTDQIHQIDMARYVEELWGELANTMGAEWSRAAKLTLAPVTLATDRAVATGLILTELVINANKYAYGGGPGPLEITLEHSGGVVRIIIADRGIGVISPSIGSGFGSRMMGAMVGQLSGQLAYEDNQPGTRAVLSLPVTDPRSSERMISSVRDIGKTRLPGQSEPLGA